MGTMALFVNVLFPIPFVCLLLLCLPLPAFCNYTIKKFITTIIDKVLFVKVLGSVNLYQMAVVISAILFGLTTYETVKVTERLHNAVDGIREEKLNCLRLRYERNFWISLFSMVLWLILYKVQMLSVDNSRFRMQLKEMEDANKAK